MSQEGHPFSALPIPEQYFPHGSGKPRMTRGSNLIGQLVPVESGGPSLLACAIFPFLIHQWNLRPTVYGGSTLVTKVVQVFICSL